MGKQGSFGVAGGIYTWRYSSGEIHSWRKRDLWLTVHTSETCYEYSCGQIKGISNWLIVDLPLRAVRMGHTLLGSFSFVRGVWVTPGHLLLWAVHLETPPPTNLCGFLSVKRGSEGQSNASGVGSIPTFQYGPPNLSDVISEHRARGDP